MNLRIPRMGVGPALMLAVAMLSLFVARQRSHRDFLVQRIPSKFRPAGFDPDEYPDRRRKTAAGE